MKAIVQSLTQDGEQRDAPHTTTPQAALRTGSRTWPDRAVSDPLTASFVLHTTQPPSNHHNSTTLYYYPVPQRCQLSTSNCSNNNEFLKLDYTYSLQIIRVYKYNLQILHYLPSTRRDSDSIERTSIQRQHSGALYNALSELVAITCSEIKCRDVYGCQSARWQLVTTNGSVSPVY